MRSMMMDKKSEPDAANILGRAGRQMGKNLLDEMISI